MTDYKQIPEYLGLLTMGMEDITDSYNSRKPTLVFRFKNRADDPNQNFPDVRYIIQKSGYVRRSVLKDGKWNMNGNIIDRFDADSEKFREIGIILLYTNLMKAKKLIKPQEAYALRASFKAKSLIKLVFGYDDKYGYMQRFIDALTDNDSWYHDHAVSIMNMLNDPKKANQGIIKLAKELGL